MVIEKIRYQYSNTEDGKSEPIWEIETMDTGICDKSRFNISLNFKEKEDI